MTISVGVDLGGTKTAAALVRCDGQTDRFRIATTPAHDGPDAMLDLVAKLVSGIVTESGEPLGSLGIATAGSVDVSTGVVVSSTDALTGWAGTSIAQELRGRLSLSADIPVVVQNDVDAHGAGESWVGAAREMPSALMVAVGTGIGGSLLLDGRPVRGAHHAAGEIGHIPVIEARGMRCSCGRVGHLEAVGSGPALHRLFLSLGGDRHCTDARGVAALAESENSVAVQAVTLSAQALGRALAGVVTTFDPSCVVVGGGLAQSGPLWWSVMEATLRSELIDVLKSLPVRPTLLGDRAAVIGAALGALESHSSARFVSQSYGAFA